MNFEAILARVILRKNVAFMLFWPKNNAFFAFFQRKIYFPFNSSQTA
jgi:hypothetical protein